MATDLQTIPGHFVHVEVADGVLQAGLDSALWDWFGDGVDVELGDLGIVVCSAAGPRHLPKLLVFFHRAADRTMLWLKLGMLNLGIG